MDSTDTAADGSAQPVLARRRPGSLDGERFDLIVVGGGITGAGVARHAAQAGLRVLVLEADDFASGTSSRSTKLIHGGLRYLAMGDIALVRESALERKSLLAMAPHLTRPRWMVVPARNRLELVKLRVGITLYEWLGDVDRSERHRNWRRGDLAVEEPALDASRFPWACAYREYLTDDARLVLAALRAAAADGAETCNHARVTALANDTDGCRVSVTDTLTGETSQLSARVVVNAAGPWAESLLPPAPDNRPRLHLSKGVHLVVAHERLPVRHMVMLPVADGRLVFAIPRGAVTYVGTTDTTYHAGAETWPTVTREDVDYLLAAANAGFTTPALEHRDVLATWAGLRPLINQPGKAPREMSRRDEIWRDGQIVTVAGGKLTGFRHMAAEVMREVGRVLERDVAMPEPLAVLPGGGETDLAGLERRIGGRYQLEAPAAARLVRLYGSETEAVLGERPRPLSASVFAEEVVWAVTTEGARHLEDAVYRRLRAAWFLPDELDGVVEGAAGVMADLLGWDDATREREIAATRARLAGELDF